MHRYLNMKPREFNFFQRLEKIVKMDTGKHEDNCITSWLVVNQQKKHKNSQKFAKNKKRRKSLQQHYISIPWALVQVGCGVSNLRIQNNKLDYIKNNNGFKGNCCILVIDIPWGLQKIGNNFRKQGTWCYVNSKNTAISLKSIISVDKIKLILSFRVRKSIIQLTIVGIFNYHHFGASVVHTSKIRICTQSVRNGKKSVITLCPQLYSSLKKEQKG